MDWIEVLNRTALGLWVAVMAFALVFAAVGVIFRWRADRQAKADIAKLRTMLITLNNLTSHFPSAPLVVDPPAPATCDRPDIPLETRLVVGYRAFSLVETANGWMLQSVYRDTLWPSPVVGASCQSGQLLDHLSSLSPDGCQCGVYSYKTLDLLHGYEDPNPVWGVVICDGIVAEHEDGYHAERVTISHLWLDERVSNMLVTISQSGILAALRARYAPATVELGRWPNDPFFPTHPYARLGTGPSYLFPLPPPPGHITR